jgi:AcrR family transcriptional regulator
MARKPKSPAPTSDADASPPQPPARNGSDRERVIDAFTALLAERSFEEIGLADIAERANLSLAELRDMFDGKIAILAARTKDIDRAVLGGAGADADMADEPPRERLFDVLMRRFEAMAHDKAAVRSLMRSAQRNPGLALELNRLAVNSQQWMLTAAGIGASGPRGILRAQGLAVMFAQVARTWIDDDDPGLARTMSALDRALARGQRLSGLLDDAFRLAALPCRVGRGLRRRPRDGTYRDYDEPGEQAARL